MKKSDINKDNLAVLIIDMQNYYLETILGKKKLQYNQMKVLKMCKRRDIPVAIIEREGKGASIQKLKNLVEMVPRQIKIEKRYNDGFQETTLHKKLLEWDVSYLFLMGVHANACVQSTAKNGLAKNFKIVTSGDTIAQWKSPFEDPNEWYTKNGIFVKRYYQIPAFYRLTDSIVGKYKN